MKHNRTPPARMLNTIAKMAEPPRIEQLGPIGARFLYSLRMIALHQRAGRDPVPELAVRLGSMESAAKTLALSQAIGSTWPENIHVSRFCCQLLTHDEATIGAMMDAVVARDRSQFDTAIEGLIRPGRIAILWDAAHDLVIAELQAV